MTDPTRIDAMIQRFQDGWTLQEIADEYGVSRQRIHQVMKRAGLTAKDGGRAKAIADRTTVETIQAEARCQREYGCSLAQLEGLKALSPSGPGRGRTPIGAFATQRNNARKRGIAWRLKLWEWWTIWQDSGHWSQRGRCANEYVMCRYGDVGAYERGNVYIATAVQNIQDYHAVHGDRYAVLMMLREPSERKVRKKTVTLPHIRGLDPDLA